MEHPATLEGINVLDETELENRWAIFGEIYDHDFNAVEGSLFYRMAMTEPYKLIVPDKPINQMKKSNFLIFMRTFLNKKIWPIKIPKS